MLQTYTFKHQYKTFDFMRWNWLAFSISGLLLILSLIIISINGFNLSLDFTGGTIIEIILEKPTNIDQIRQAIEKAGIHKLLLQNFGSSCNVIVRIPTIQNSNHRVEWGSIIVNIINKTNNQHAIVKHIEYIGPNVGNDLIQNYIMALIATLISILMYIWFRFEWRLSTSIVIALIHDVIITIGVLSLFSIEVDLTILTSLMAIIGYSLNDSIVISDRIRENFQKIHHSTPYEILNISLTQTLHRTLTTSSITLLMILILYFFGGQILKFFSLTMLIGIPIGTISSVYISSALALTFGIRKEHLLIQKIKKEDNNHPYYFR